MLHCCCVRELLIHLFFHFTSTMSCFWSRGHFILSISCLKKKKKILAAFPNRPQACFFPFFELTFLATTFRSSALETSRWRRCSQKALESTMLVCCGLTAAWWRACSLKVTSRCWSALPPWPGEWICRPMQLSSRFYSFEFLCFAFILSFLY